MKVGEGGCVVEVGDGREHGHFKPAVEDIEVVSQVFTCSSGRGLSSVTRWVTAANKQLAQ